MTIQELKIQEIKKFCKTNKVKSLFAFGFITRDDFNKDSEMDLVVDLKKMIPINTQIYIFL